MIIKALCDYYDVLSKEGKVLPDGFSRVGIHYLVELGNSGELKGIIDCRIHETYTKKNGKTAEKVRPRMETMPFSGQYSKIVAHPVDSRPLYIFGLDREGGKLTAHNDGDRARRSHEAFVTENMRFTEGMDSPIATAFRNFLTSWDPEGEEGNEFLSALGASYGMSGYAFCLEGHPEILLHEDPEIKERRSTEYASQEGKGLHAQCAVYGTQDALIAKTHDKVKGFPGSSFGAVLVGYNNPSEESYGRVQSYNSSISEKAMHKYTAALNILMADPYHHVFIGDTAVVFWAEGETDGVDGLADFFSGNTNVSAEQAARMASDTAKDSISGSVNRERLGMLRETADNRNIYVLGIKPNNSRLAIKFFYKSGIADFMENAAKFREEVSITGQKFTPTIKSIVRELSPAAKAGNDDIDKAAESMGNALTTSVIRGAKYPSAILPLLVQRIRADGNINGTRAGMMKAFINRKQGKEVVTMALNYENCSQPYLCGRLLATAEKIQQEAVESNGGKLNRTVKDAQGTLAAVSPARAIPHIIQTAELSLNKLSRNRPGRSVYFEKLMGEIMDKMGDEFMRQVPLTGQCEYYAGYFQQRQEFFKKKETPEETNEDGTAVETVETVETENNGLMEGAEEC